jgi:hypothetical protein
MLTTVSAVFEYQNIATLVAGVYQFGDIGLIRDAQVWIESGSPPAAGVFPTPLATAYTDDNGAINNVAVNVPANATGLYAVVFAKSSADPLSGTVQVLNATTSLNWAFSGVFIPGGQSVPNAVEA